MNFKNFLFHPQVAAGIEAAGYATPTPIQAQAIPNVMQGRDLMGLAQTGTGKTAVFVLPILHRLLHGKRGRVRSLIVAPTRELAEQIHQAIEVLGVKTGLRSVTVYGGVGIQRQIQLLKRADIVVACPGRLLDHIGRKTVDLSHVEVLVLDEADQMFDMGFLPDIRRILGHLPKSDRQTLLFSATYPDTIKKMVEWRGLDVFTSLPGRIAAIAAIENQDHLQQEVARNAKVRDFTRKWFHDAGYEDTESQTNFVYVDIRQSAAEFRKATLERGVRIGGVSKLYPNYARVTIGTMDEMERAIKVFSELLPVKNKAVA